MTQQIVVGNTYVFNSTAVADLHLSYLRWNYVRTPGFLGHPGGHGFRLALVHELRHPQQPGEVDGRPVYEHLGADQLHRRRRGIHLLHQQQLRDWFYVPEDLEQAHLQNRHRSSPHGDGLLPEQFSPGASSRSTTCSPLQNAAITRHHRQRAWHRLNWDMSPTARRKPSRLRRQHSRLSTIKATLAWTPGK